METGQPFNDRHDAGRRLAERLMPYADRSDVVVLGLPRGGIPVAYEVAKRLQAPLDVFVVRKLGVPGRQELAMGALASGHTVVVDQEMVDHFNISKDLLEAIIRTEEQEFVRREHLYRDHRKPMEVKGQTVILVDDGLATGSSMRAAVQALGAKHPARIVVAAPVASREACAEFKQKADEMICAMTPEPFYAVGQWYKDFSQTSDEEVRRLLAEAQGSL
jgi:putative phosphoribosyl transferase